MSMKFGIVIGATLKGFDAIGSAVKSTKILNTKLSDLKAQRVDLGRKFGFASKEAKALNSDILKLTRNTKQLQRSINIGASMEQYREKFRSSFMDKVALGAAVFAPIKVAIDFESAMADVKKVVNFDSNDELKLFQKSITDLSKKIPLSADGLAQIVASGGQLGIAKEKLLDFTKTTAKMSTAFDMLPDEAGEASAKLMNVFALGINDVSKLGDAINHLSDNTASKARDVVNVLSRVGGSAKVFGLSATQTSSLASAFLALGKPAEVSGTAINALLLKLGTADKQGAKFQDALNQIGLDSEGLKQKIKQNGEGAIVEFLERINSISADDRMGILSDLFGAEYSDDIALLSSGVDNYKKSIKLLSDEQKYSGSMQREFEARSATTANNMKLMGNTLSAIAINFGSVLLPAINSILSPIREFSGWISDVAGEFPTLSKWIGGITFGVVGLGLALSGVGYVGSFVISGFANLSKAFLVTKGLIVSSGIALNGFSLATTVAAAKQWALNLALNANPIGLIITGIGALIGLGVVLYKNFEPFKNLIDGIWESAKSFFGWIGDKLSGFGNALGSIGSFFGFGDEDEKPLKKAMTPAIAKTNLVAAPIPQYKLNEQSLNIPTHKEIQEIRQSNITNNSSSAPVTKNYTIQVSVQNPSSSIDITDAVKQAIRDIEADSNERSMGDSY